MPKLFKSKKKLLILSCLLVLAFIIGLIAHLPITKTPLVSEVKAQSVSAFPGAEGFGAKSIGGRGGRVIEVTNTNDSGSGSLRACVEASGPRICVFRTGGTINGGFSISNPYITIAGQTAPGGGITVKGGDIYIRTHDVILRYISSRRGPGGENHALSIGGSGETDIYNIVIDHSSMSWATDETYESWYGPHDLTIQWSIISEGLDCSTHSKGCHSKGAMLGGYKLDEAWSDDGAERISFHHNLLAHNGERNPLVKSSGIVDVVNNVIYNPYWTFSHVDMQSKTVIPVNFIGNYYKRGPDSQSGKYEIKAINSGDSEIYVEGNIGPNRPSDGLPEANCVEPDSRSYVVTTHHPVEEVTTTSAFEAYNQVLANAGATIGLDSQGSSFSRRDAIDERIVNDVKNGTGRIIDHPSEVGGWLNIAAGTPYADSDHDGMADKWEDNHFGNLSRGSASNSSSDYDGDGYTDLEEFLNGTNPRNDSLPTSTPTPSPSPSSCPADVNNDNFVNVADIISVLQAWGACPGGCKEDLDANNTVNVADIIIILSSWGRCR